MGALDSLRAAASTVVQLVRGDYRPPAGAVVVDTAQVTRWICDWTPTILKGAVAGAHGDVNIPQIVALCEDMLHDDRLRAVLDTRIQALLGLDLTFEEGTGRRKLRAQRAAESEADFWDIYPEEEVSQTILWGLLLNRGPGRLGWWERDLEGNVVPRTRRGRIVPRYTAWSPRSVRRDRLNGRRTWKVRVEFEDERGVVLQEQEVEFGAGEWCLFSPYGGDGAVDRGLWIALAHLWLLKLMALRDWGNLGATMGNPIKLIEFALGQQGVNAKEFAGDTTRDNLVKKIFALGKRGVISLPPGFTMKLLSAPATSPQMFQAQIDMVNTAYAVTVLGSNLATEIKGGSLAAAQISNLVRADKRRFDAGAESNFTRGQGLVFWAAVNFGDPEAAPWPTRNTEPPEDIAATAQVWVHVATAAEKFKGKVGWELDQDSVGEQFRIPFKKKLETPGEPDTTADA